MQDARSEPTQEALPPESRPASNDGSEEVAQKDSGWKQFSRRNPWIRLVLICAGIALFVTGLLLWRYLGSYESTDDAQIEAHLNPMSARVSGQVANVLVKDNQYVTAGTPLVQIDPRDYQVAVDRAKADYADAMAMAEAARVNVPVTTATTGSQVSAAQADVENANAGISMARQQLDAARAQLQAAEANNAKAQSDLARYKQLVDKQEISEQQYDQAVAAAKANAAGVEATRASASAAQQQVRQAQSKLAQAQANAASAATGPQQVAAIRSRAQAAEAAADLKKAALAQAELDLQYTLIVAPINGVVTDRNVEVGQNLQAGQEVMKIINLDDVWVAANFKETQLKEMKPGQKVTISVDGTAKEYNGYVQSIAGASGEMFSMLPPENATGNYVKVVQRVPVKIYFDAGATQQHDLRPGMSVEPKVWVR
jgi:membrane fusion protein (multidrug efflux system)